MNILKRITRYPRLKSYLLFEMRRDCWGWLSRKLDSFGFLQCRPGFFIAPRYLLGWCRSCDCGSMNKHNKGAINRPLSIIYGGSAHEQTPSGWYRCWMSFTSGCHCLSPMEHFFKEFGISHTASGFNSLFSEITQYESTLKCPVIIGMEGLNG